jgi:hypothetical protein
MLKKLMISGVAVGLMALNAPIAHAAVVRSGCGFQSVAQETATGGQDTFTGAAYGYAIFDDQDTHTLKCVVKVDGAAQAETPPGSGQVVVTTQGQVTYNAAEGATVVLCTVIDDVEVGCNVAMEFQVPPQEVIDLLDTIFQAISDASGLLDPIVCTMHQALAPGIPGVIDITPEGDVTLAVIGPFWDCPPYGNLPPA